MYKVLIGFIDSQDDMYEYFKGDSYPREGHKPSQKRIKELSTKANPNKRIFIVKDES